jgi:hypothetical protein
LEINENNKDFENGTDIAIKIGCGAGTKIKLESNNDDNKINEFERLNILYSKILIIIYYYYIELIFIL